MVSIPPPGRAALGVTDDGRSAADRDRDGVEGLPAVAGEVGVDGDAVAAGAPVAVRGGVAGACGAVAEAPAPGALEVGAREELADLPIVLAEHDALPHAVRAREG